MDRNSSPLHVVSDDYVSERVQILALLSALMLLTGCSRDEALSPRVVAGDAARAEILQRAKRQDSSEPSIPDSAGNFYFYEGGSFNGSIIYWSLECANVDDCWLAIKELGGPARQQFRDWRPSKFAVVMEGPGYYSPETKTSLWDVQCIERGKVYESFRGDRRLDYYAVDFDRRRVLHHRESGGFPATPFPRPE